MVNSNTYMSIFWHSLISLGLTILFAYIFKLHPNSKYGVIIFAGLFAGLYILISEIMTRISNFKSGSDQQIFIPTQQNDLFSNGIYIEKPAEVFPDSTIKFHTVEVPVMGPLDGLDQKDVLTRMNYLYRQTATPYKYKSYYDFVNKQSGINKGYKLSKGTGQSDADYKINMERWYPTLTKDLDNIRDCTSFAPGSPASCLIKNPNPYANDGGLLDNSLKSKVEAFENMSMPKGLGQQELRPIYWNTAPQNQDIAGDISENMVRGGIVGICRSDYCSSSEPNRIELPDNLIENLKYKSTHDEGGIFSYGKRYN